MNLSFREKSIIGSLIITAALFGYYFFTVFRILTSGSSEAAIALPLLLIGVVIAVVVVEIVYHILIATVSRPQDEDERDRLIEARATRIAYFVLVTGCILTIGHSTLSVFFPGETAERVVQGPIMTANFILLSFILAEIVGFAMQLYYYRRGV